MLHLTCRGMVSFPIAASPMADKGAFLELGRGGNDALSSVGVETVDFTWLFLTSFVLFSLRSFWLVLPPFSLPSAVSRLCAVIFLVCCISLDAPGGRYTGCVSLGFVVGRVECVSLEAMGVGFEGCGSLVVSGEGWGSRRAAEGVCVSCASLGVAGG